MSKKKRSRNLSGLQSNAEAVAENNEKAVVNDSAAETAEGKDDFAQAVSALADATGIISVIPPRDENKEEAEKEKEKAHKRLEKSEHDDQFKEMIDDALDENVEARGILDDSTSQAQE